MQTQKIIDQAHKLASKSEKQGFHFVSGVMVYREAVTGKEISFFITKVA